MPSNVEKSGEKRLRQAGLFAQSILTRGRQVAANVSTVMPSSSAVVWVGERMNQSKGLSDWSIQIRDAISEPLAEYLTETAHNWGRDFTVLTFSAQEQSQSRFTRLAEEWRKGRGVSSNLSHLVMHPAYQQIIGMGPAVVPLLLKELDQAPDHWFWALKAITGEDPVAEADRGNLKRMAQAWLKWGRNRGVV